MPLDKEVRLRKGDTVLVEAMVEMTASRRGAAVKLRLPGRPTHETFTRELSQIESVFSRYFENGEQVLWKAGDGSPTVEARIIAVHDASAWVRYTEGALIRSHIVPADQLTPAQGWPAEPAERAPDPPRDFPVVDNRQVWTAPAEGMPEVRDPDEVQF